MQVIDEVTQLLGMVVECFDWNHSWGVLIGYIWFTGGVLKIIDSSCLERLKACVRE